MENNHLQAAMHEYSAMIHSLEETCRRLTDELSVGKHDHALSVNRASALLGDLEGILQGGASEAQRQRAVPELVGQLGGRLLVELAGDLGGAGVA